jgi:hypothetical protein
VADAVKTPEMEVPVVADVDVLVVGGGPAGVAAAVCAARQGVDTMLVERYGYLGGLATGALVIALDDMYHDNQITVAGIVDELQDRLERLGALVRPPEEEWFKVSQELHKKWYWWGLLDGWGREEPSAVAYRALFDVETGKYVFFQMLEEAGVKLRLHSWCTTALIEDDQITGVILFSKSGYHAVRAKLVIDTTGDGDVFASAGAEYIHGGYFITVAHFIGNADTAKAMKFVEEHPKEAKRLNDQVKDIYGGSWAEWWQLTTNPGVVWCDCPHISGYDGIDVEHLTYLEEESRKRIWRVLDFVRKNYPGFENAYIARTADQIGVRQTRLLVGEYMLTREDVTNGVQFEDAVGRGKGYYYPYRCLVPKRVDNLLVAGRHCSIESVAQRQAREWPPCMVTGQAVGTAAAIALESGVKARDVNMPTLQRRLEAQAVIL